MLIRKRFNMERYAIWDDRNDEKTRIRYKIPKIKNRSTLRDELYRMSIVSTQEKNEYQSNLSAALYDLRYVYRHWSVKWF